MQFTTTITLLLVVAAVTHAGCSVPFYSAYRLSDAETHELVARQCFRGVYGSDGVALHTCANTTSQRLFDAPHDAALCLLELPAANASLRQAVLDRISLYTSAGQAKLLANLPNELVLINPGNASEYPPVCSWSDFDGLVANAIFLPREAIAGQAGVASDHPAYLRSLLPVELIGARAPVQNVLSHFTEASVRNYVAWLSTDRQGLNSKITRNSYAIKSGAGGCADASTWRCAHTVVDELVAEVKKLMAAYPHAWSVEKLPFRSDMCANVRLKIAGAKSSRVVVMGAHVDSRNTASGAAASGPAPGADDNGSGSAANLAAVKAIAASGVRLTNALHIVWFCGEEQGLLGSAAMAKEYKAAGTDVVMMLNADMIGYTDPKYGVTLSFDKRSVTASVTDSCKKYSQVYQPTLKIGSTDGCCSDNQSFYNQGFPTVGIFETPTTGISYPYYHKSTDTWDSGAINYKQIQQFGASALACVLEFADPI